MGQRDGDDDYDDEPDEIFDSEGNTVWSRWYEGQFVDRTCEYCKRGFRGLPSYGVCGRCADILERGGDPQRSD